MELGKVYRRRDHYTPRLDLRTLTPEQVARIRMPGADLPALAAQFRISRVAAWKVKQYITYRDLP